MMYGLLFNDLFDWGVIMMVTLLSCICTLYVHGPSCCPGCRGNQCVRHVCEDGIQIAYFRRLG